MSRRLTLVGVIMAALAGCHGNGSSNSTPQAGESADVKSDSGGCPVTTDVSGMSLGKGTKYAATRYRSGIMIHARGMNPTPRWENRLHASKKDVYPTRFEFYQKAPAGIVNQLETPFDVCLFYPTLQRIDSITVSDSDGDHAVQVED